MNGFGQPAQGACQVARKGQPQQQRHDGGPNGSPQQPAPGAFEKRLFRRVASRHNAGLDHGADRLPINDHRLAASHCARRQALALRVHRISWSNDTATAVEQHQGRAHVVIIAALHRTTWAAVIHAACKAYCSILPRPMLLVIGCRAFDEGVLHLVDQQAVVFARGQPAAKEGDQSHAENADRQHHERDLDGKGLGSNHYANPSPAKRYPTPKTVST